jgi:hypothetical protein
MRLAPVEKDGGDILAQFTRMWKNTSKFCYSAKLRLFFPHYCAILGRTILEHTILKQKKAKIFVL